MAKEGGHRRAALLSIFPDASHSCPLSGGGAGPPTRHGYDRAKARATILKSLHTADPWDVEHLVVVLASLNLTEEDRVQARATILKALHNADG